MSIWDILQALVHRWYVVVAIGVVAAGVAYAAVSAGGVYWSRVEVTFIAPSSTVNPNSLAVTSSDLVITAGVVAKRINGNADRPVMADAATTLVGEGMLDGWAVRLPDYGGQWSTVYSRQVLDVQATGPSEQAVLARIDELLARIDAELADLQQGVAESDRISTLVVPEEPSVYHIRGSRIRALAMIGVLAGALALTVVVLLDGQPRLVPEPRGEVMSWRVPQHRSPRADQRAGPRPGRR